MGVAGLIMPLFTGTLNPSATALTAGLSRVLFPVVLLLSLTGLLVGILQSYDEFSIPALAPAVWNIVIVVLMVDPARPLPRAGRDLLLRDRVAGGDRRAVPADRLGAAARSSSASPSRLTGATRACARC